MAAKQDFARLPPLITFCPRYPRYPHAFFICATQRIVRLSNCHRERSRTATIGRTSRRCARPRKGPSFGAVSGKAKRGVWKKMSHHRASEDETDFERTPKIAPMVFGSFAIRLPRRGRIGLRTGLAKRTAQWGPILGSVPICVWGGAVFRPVSAPKAATVRESRRPDIPHCGRSRRSSPACCGFPPRPPREYPGIRCCRRRRYREPRA